MLKAVELLRIAFLAVAEAATAFMTVAEATTAFMAVAEATTAFMSAKLLNSSNAGPIR
jgi:hypothetical protein